MRVVDSRCCDNGHQAPASNRSTQSTHPGGAVQYRVSQHACAACPHQRWLAAVAAAATLPAACCCCLKDSPQPPNKKGCSGCAAVSAAHVTLAAAAAAAAVSFKLLLLLQLLLRHSLEVELPQRLNKGAALNVAHCAAQLDHTHVCRPHSTAAQR